MNRTDRVIDGLLEYLKEHPNERKEIADIILDISNKLKDETLTLLATSNYIKKLPQPQNIAIHMIFVDVYRKTSE